MGNKDRETREWRERAGISLETSLINATHRLNSGLLPPFFVLISPILIRFLQSAHRYSEDALEGVALSSSPGKIGSLQNLK